MDPLAHTLFGATLSEAGLRKKTAYATGTLIFAANIPDIDALAMFIDDDISLLVRRGWTHGILALMIWPLLITGLILLADRYRRNRRGRPGGPSGRRPGHPAEPPLRSGWLLGIAYTGVLSHPFLDWLNTYGIRILMPFDDTWFYGDTLFIVDPWAWLLLGAGVVLARSRSSWGIAGWVILGTATTAIVTGAAAAPLAVKILWCVGIAGVVLVRLKGWQRKRAERVALGCLVIFGIYLIFMVAGSRTAVWMVGQELADRGVEVKEVMAAPQPARLFLRSGVAVSETHYYLFRLHWPNRESFELTSEPVPIREPDRVVEAAFRSPDVQGLLNWIRFPSYEARPQADGGWLVFIRDLRYVSPDQESATGIGIGVVELDAELRIRER